MGFFKKQREKFNKKMDAGNHGQLYRIINSISMTGIFIVAAVIVLSISGIFAMTSTIFGLTGTVMFLCLAAMLALPWVKWIEKKQHKKLAIVFLALIAVCLIMWIVCLWLGVSLYRQLRDGAGLNAVDNFVGTINTMKFTLVFSLQFIFASTIANGIIKYKKTYIPFQAFTYASHLYLDFYITTFIFCLSFSKAEGHATIALSQNVNILIHPVTLTILALSVVFMAISSGFMKRLEKDRAQQLMETTVELAEKHIEQLEKGETPKTEPKAKEEESIEEKLAQLKNLLDKKLITQEEYDQKRKELIDNL